jgi:hypothetical protein
LAFSAGSAKAFFDRATSCVMISRLYQAVVIRSNFCKVDGAAGGCRDG